MTHSTWPLYDVVVRTPLIELRLATEDEWTDLVGSISPAIYERTGVMPFTRDWPSSPPAEAMQHRWRALADWTADSWQFQATVFVDGRPVGYETTHRDHFLFGDERAEQFNMIMRRSDWEQHPLHRRDDITIDRLEPVLDWFIAPTSDA